MNRARGTIVWLFGAGGVGKTRLAERLANSSSLNVVGAFSGAYPKTWPDEGAYAEELARRGAYDPTDHEQQLDRISRCYDLAGSLATTKGGVVLLDSCPRGEKILHDTADASVGGRNAWHAAVEAFDATERAIHTTAGSTVDVMHVGVHVTLPRLGSQASRAAVLMDRLIHREGDIAELDAQTAIAAGHVLAAGDTLESVLGTQGDISVRVESLGVVDERMVAAEILSQIPRAA